MSDRDGSVGAPTKVCPACAETVLDAAVICRHCSHDFRLPLNAAHGGGWNGFAIASFVTSILIPVVGMPLSLGLGLIARRQIARSGGRERGDGLAIAGMTIAMILFVMWFFTTGGLS